jgi:hypothetical protein
MTVAIPPKHIPFLKLRKVDVLDHRVSLAEFGVGAGGNVQSAIAPPTASGPRSSNQPAHMITVPITRALSITPSVPTWELLVPFAHTDRWSSSLAVVSCTEKRVPHCHMHSSPGPVES